MKHPLKLSGQAIYLAISERKTYSKIPTPIGIIDALDLKFKVINEDWNVYDLEDGTQLRVRINVSKISRGIDPKTGEVFIGPTGEPFYNVVANTTMVANVPKETLEKLTKK
jgi:hypothetical protein